MASLCLPAVGSRKEVATRSALRNWVEYGTVRGVVGLIAILPDAVAMVAARACLKLLNVLVPKLQMVAQRNLVLTGLDQDNIQQMYESLARMLVSFSRFPKLKRSNIDQYIRYEGFEHFDRALAKGKGVLFATAHLGNWELSAFAHALLAKPMHVVVRPLDNPLIDAFVERRRSLSGNTILGKRDFLRDIFRALQHNQAVGILVDQNVSASEGVFVDFFGKKACVSPAFAKLAARTEAAVIPGFAVWNDAEQKYVLRFYPPVVLCGETVEDTQRIQSAVEAAIREYPGQWLWMHRRWKTRPPGESPLY